MEDHPLIDWLDILGDAMGLNHHEALIVKAATISSCCFWVGNGRLDPFYFHFPKFSSREIHNEPEIEEWDP